MQLEGVQVPCPILESTFDSPCMQAGSEHFNCDVAICQYLGYVQWFATQLRVAMLACSVGHECRSGKEP